MSTRVLVVLLVSLLWSGTASAQEQDRTRVEVTVTAVNSAGPYLDHGSDSGMEPGDRVLLFPTGFPETTAVVRSVTRGSARCEWIGAATGVQVGTRGEALVPDGRAQGGTAAHQDWKYPPEEWNEDMPLLAPPQSLEASERATRMSGRWYNQFDSTWDRYGDRRYSLVRSGVDMLVENPFQNGGGMHLDAEIYRRVADLDAGRDEDDTRFRLDRFSYYSGGTRDDPRRFEVGRFLQSEFPEFGVLDGLEFTQRLASRDRIGGSVGFLPEPFPEMMTGEDLQVAGYYKHFAGSDDQVALGLGLQKTWHEGEADRDLVVTTAEWTPDSQLALYGAAWVDYYDSSDVVKPEGFELTELHVNGSYRWDTGQGLGLGVSHQKWPELLRDEFRPLPPADLLDSEVTRVYLSGWTPLSTDLRLSARADRWTDEDDSGSGGSVRLGWRDLLYAGGEIGLEAFASDGAFSSVLGGRLSATGTVGAGFWNAMWEVSDFEQAGFSGDQENLLQQSVRGGYDRLFASGWNLSIYVDQRFGDEQDWTALGLFLQRRF